MITRSQIILLKRAQREAGLEDLEYRDGLALTAGCRSSTDDRMTERGVDLALAYFEAIFWRKVDAGELQPSGKADAVFRQRGYWAAKNRSGSTSRDRWTRSHTIDAAAALEGDLEQLGCSPAYLAAIRAKVVGNRTGPAAEFAYQAALRRTLAAKRKKLAQV
jgi:hypothetical protein